MRLVLSGLAFFALPALLVLGTAACGEPEESADASAADTVRVTLRDSALFMPRAIRAGATLFEVRNAGTVPRGFRLVGDAGTDSIQGPLQPGATRTMQLHLSPGVYEAYGLRSGRPTADLDEHVFVGEGWGQRALPPGSDLRSSRRRP